jgi:hypothetical protein
MVRSILEGNMFPQMGLKGVCGAICDGIDKWMMMTMFTTVLINGPTEMLLPGCVVDPPLMPFIFASAPKNTPQEMKYSNAIATAFGTLWQPWHMGLTGTLMYPAFAAFPEPMAPPTPNFPIPLVTFSSSGESGLSPSTLKSTMEGNLGDPKALHASDLFDAIAKAFNTVFQTFKASTLVRMSSAWVRFPPSPPLLYPWVPWWQVRSSRHRAFCSSVSF